MSKVGTLVHIRPYADLDEEGVLELLNEALGGGPAGTRPAGFFRWKHFENPFGRSFMLVATVNGRIVGLRAFMRWEFSADGHRLRAVRAVDTATHPDYQGQGIFSRLTLEALDMLRDEVDFIFNTPNDKSLPGYLKMGWHIVGKVPISVRVRRPIRFARRIPSWRAMSALAASVSVPESDADVVSDVLEQGSLDDLLKTQERLSGITTPRDATYLSWRYGTAPLLDYRAVIRGRFDRPEALAIFRVRPRGELVECTLAETIVRAGDARSAGHLLRAVRRSTSSDHVTSSFPPGTASRRAAWRAGFLRVPGGMTLVVNPLGHRSDPDPLDLRSWALSVGDLEVF